MGWIGKSGQIRSFYSVKCNGHLKESRYDCLILSQERPGCHVSMLQFVRRTEDRIYEFGYSVGDTFAEDVFSCLSTFLTYQRSFLGKVELMQLYISSIKIASQV